MWGSRCESPCSIWYLWPPIKSLTQLLDVSATLEHFLLLLLLCTHPSNRFFDAGLPNALFQRRCDRNINLLTRHIKWNTWWNCFRILEWRMRIRWTWAAFVHLIFIYLDRGHRHQLVRHYVIIISSWSQNSNSKNVKQQQLNWCNHGIRLSAAVHLYIFITIWQVH